MRLFEYRASTIIYNIITSLDNDKPFLIPSNVCPIVVATFLKAGRAIEFIDISVETLCIDEQKILSLLERSPNKYAGILFVRTYGVADSFDSFFNKIKNINKAVLIIDDYCLAPPDFDNYPLVADVNVYSTGYSKFVDLGWGAFANLKNEMPYLRTEAEFSEYDLDILNTSFRNAINKMQGFDFSLINTNWLNTGVPHITFEEYKKTTSVLLEKSKIAKQKYNHIYSSLLNKHIQLVPKFQNWRFNIIVPQKNLLLEKIFNAGLFASSHYAPATMIFYRSTAENSDLLYENVLNLFSDNCFDFERAETMTKIVNEHCQNTVIKSQKYWRSVLKEE